MIIGTKLNEFFILGTKNGKIEKYELKWKWTQDIETKIGFIPCFLLLGAHAQVITYKLLYI